MTRAMREEPPAYLRFAEMARAFGEASAMVMSLPALPLLPRGDGHGVLLLPGMLGDDWSTVPLRQSLLALGYDARGWGLGSNLGFKTIGHDLSKVMVVAERLSRETGGRSISLVGMSLGGIIAREIAKARPDLVRQVITLASPFNHPPEDAGPGKILQAITGDTNATKLDHAALAQPPEGIPSTAIYSESDGIVSWRACLEPEGPMTDNIAIASSHIGIGMHPAMLLAVADRLALPEGQWQPFDRTAHPWRQAAFLEPAAAEKAR